jgi:peptide-methionine (S)-S-oxide reductase
MDKGKIEEAAFAAGCFWGVEDTFRQIPGVIETEVGFMGGGVENPSYEQVSTTETGHAETVHIKFDPAKVSFEKLLETFWNSHNPTTKNRQGPDVGTQYRSIIFFYNSDQKKMAEASKEALEKSEKWKNPIVTEITAAGKFNRAEEYHQKYLLKRGLSTCHV